MFGLIWIKKQIDYFRIGWSLFSILRPSDWYDCIAKSSSRCRHNNNISSTYKLQESLSVFATFDFFLIWAFNLKMNCEISNTIQYSMKCEAPFQLDKTKIPKWIFHWLVWKSYFRRKSMKQYLLSKSRIWNVVHYALQPSTKSDFPIQTMWTNIFPFTFKRSQRNW